MIQKTITPKDKIVNLSFEIPKNYVGKSLKVSIDFENEVDQIESNLSKEDFVKWIENAEKSKTMSLEKFNEKWEEKKLKIQNNIR
ncbi:MAG: hypothetical protein REI96_02820 [Flavobacterium nitrogenifigens]|uniref:Uncharacterized protein n=1 Tax=Flavobacterium nitrogenifigens TaxID=1617283 RepID=A0A521CQ77_9FLAO|nr:MULTISPECIES: hypothetical protein [Flavobacterium]KAF2328403.1 hypothetical protein DM397_17685 [Flavobacterium nitrogenifigens]KAF2336351.1 hypothetical protein FND99_03455 [Flavobacterium daemonense]MDQ8011356.1 hypothetical protein [Flavobacterium nitrogenifigens]SMO61624.1 hypothetical protein SAMN06265220_102534 [Flavobacterium nitrogenifigens]